MYSSITILIPLLLSFLISSTYAEKTVSTALGIPSGLENSLSHDLAARVDGQEGSFTIRTKLGLYYLLVFVNGQGLKLELDTGSSSTCVPEPFHILDSLSQLFSSSGRLLTAL